MYVLFTGGFNFDEFIYVPNQNAFGLTLLPSHFASLMYYSGTTPTIHTSLYYYNVYNRAIYSMIMQIILLPFLSVVLLSVFVAFNVVVTQNYTCFEVLKAMTSVIFRPALDELGRVGTSWDEVGRGGTRVDGVLSKLMTVDFRDRNATGCTFILI